MKSRNLIFLFSFIFLLCFVFTYLGWSQDPTWNISPSIKMKYPESTTEKDWVDLKDDLNARLFHFNEKVRNYFSPKAKNKVVAELLVGNAAVIRDIEDGELKTSVDDIRRIFNRYHPKKHTVNIAFLEGQWIYVDGEARGVEVDIIALIKFNIVFSERSKRSDDNGHGDRIVYEGEMTSFHRKICVWF